MLHKSRPEEMQMDPEPAFKGGSDQNHETSRSEPEGVQSAHPDNKHCLSYLEIGG